MLGWVRCPCSTAACPVGRLAHSAVMQRKRSGMWPVGGRPSSVHPWSAHADRRAGPTPCAGWVWSALACNWSTPRGPGARAAPGRGLVGCRPIAYSHLPLREHLSVSKVLTPGVFCIKRAPGPALARAGGRRLAGAYGASGLPPSWRLRQQSGGASKKGRIRGTSPQARVTLWCRRCARLLPSGFRLLAQASG